MKTEFEEKLEGKVFTIWNDGYHEYDTREKRTEEIKQLFLYTFLKIVGNETKISYSRENPIPFWRNIGRNKLRKELKAKVFAELGMKEK